MSENSRSYIRALVGIHLLYLLLQLPLWGYLTDDTYIHLVYARNLLLGKGWVFNLGEPSYGSTSPLWVLLLAPLASSEAAGLFGARFLSVVAGLLSIFVFHRLASRSISRPSLRLAATLLFATEVWLIRWSASGMEGSLAVLVLLLLLDGLAASPYRARGVFGVGILAGLAGLVRPEYYLLDHLLLGLALLSRRWRRHWWSLLLGVALPLLPWLVFAQLELGGAFPSTAAAKSRGLPELGHLLLQTWRLLRIPLSSQGLLLLIATAGSVACLLGGSCRRPRPGFPSSSAGSRFRFYALLAGLWACALPAVFVLRDVQVISRYLLPVTPILPLAACYFLDLWSDRWPRLIRLLPLVLLLTLLPNLYFYGWRVLPHARAFPADLESSLGRMADHLRVHGLRGARVAAPDIGLLGFRSGCEIVDLGGLIHPEIGAHWHEHGYRRMVENLEFLRYREAEYLVDRDPQPARLAGAAGDDYILLPIMQSRVSGLGLRKPEPLFYSLYRIGRRGPETAPADSLTLREEGTGSLDAH